MSGDVIVEDLAYLVTVDAEDRVLRDASVLVSQGRIAAIGDAAQLARRAPDAQRVGGRHRLMLPGLVNLHTHTPMTLLRGIAEGVDLQGFLERVWAAEGAAMDPETVELGAQLGALESLSSGSTTQLDMYFHPAAAHRGAVRVGSRHVIGPTALDFPGPDGLAWDQRLQAAADWPGELARIGGPWVPANLGPHATYTVSQAHLRELGDIAAGFEDVVFTTHVSENRAENADVLHRYGKTPTRILADAGLLDGRFPVVFGHGVHLDEADRALVRAAGASVAHCPGSNLKLASGELPWQTYREAGLLLGLGTDGCSSSNDLDMWTAMRLAGLLARVTAGRPDVAPATEVLRAATIDGARALGMDQRIGSIEVGKEADLVMIDIDQPHLTPVHDVAALLVFAAGRGDVTDVFVAGEQVIAERRSTRVDTGDLLARCRERGAVAGSAAARLDTAAQQAVSRP